MAINKQSERLRLVVFEAHVQTLAVQSNFAREHAGDVAMAASMGLISTRVMTGIYCRSWLPTSEGLKFLEKALGPELFDGAGPQPSEPLNFPPEKDVQTPFWIKELYERSEKKKVSSYSYK